MLAGMVKISWYPRAAATNAKPMPVLPLVGSTRVVTPGTHTIWEGNDPKLYRF
jgi:hypothetical protein